MHIGGRVISPPPPTDSILESEEAGDLDSLAGCTPERRKSNGSLAAHRMQGQMVGRATLLSYLRVVVDQHQVTSRWWELCWNVELTSMMLQLVVVRPHL